jgi:hypothetical protein
MKVLVACEFSGIVRDAFIAQGHEAVSCDLEESERPGPHYQCDVRELDLSVYDLMIAHPPCTYLANSGVRHLHSIPSRTGKLPSIHGKARWTAMYAAAEFFNWLKRAPVQHIAIENPIPHGYARALIGDYDDIVQPYFFGDPVIKRVCWWLKNLPMLIPTETRLTVDAFPTPHWEPPSPTRWKERSRFYPGMAAAMAQQWEIHGL